MIFNRDSMRMNKLLYHIIPDGVVSVYVSEGNATGPLGYIDPVLKIVKRSLVGKDDNVVAKNTKITTLLPIRDP